jgi:hypothetical protein
MELVAHAGNECSSILLSIAMKSVNVAAKRRLQLGQSPIFESTIDGETSRKRMRMRRQLEPHLIDHEHLPHMAWKDRGKCKQVSIAPSSPCSAAKVEQCISINALISMLPVTLWTHEPVIECVFSTVRSPLRYLDKVCYMEC